MSNKEQIAEALFKVLSERGVGDGKAGSDRDDQMVPIGISNRHIHLSQEDLEVCFGKGYELTPIKDLSQPGQFACKETMTVAGPKGAIEKVRILGPTRKQSQVELLAGDNFKLGIKAPLRMSGDLKDSAGVTLIGTEGSVCLKEGAIVAARHIHMSPSDAERYGVENGQIVCLELDGPRGGVLQNVVIRADEKGLLDCHLDTEEANAMGLSSASKGRIIK